ncbi:hypothetical protein OG21DRAFT_303087 [Imleria badia]|nr:hypothetical protein OG21DRAFT_303087 [Imleria badia]
MSHRILYRPYCHDSGHVNKHPAQSHPTYSRHKLNGTLTRRPVSRDWRNEPDIRVDHAALDLWKYNQLADTEALLTAAIATPQNPSHHLLAGRALVRARLRQWDAALGDAEKSIKIESSIIGYIAKSVALVGKGEKHKAYRACDFAFDHFLPSPVSLRFLLLIKAIIVFMAGEHDDAISRVDDLITMVGNNNSRYYVVQARI